MKNLYKAGTKLKSAVCDTQIMVLRVPSEPIDLRCGGVPMVEANQTADAASLDPAFAGGSLTGKRYTDTAETMEFLCTKGGEGRISADGIALDVKQAKALPSSD